MKWIFSVQFMLYQNQYQSSIMSGFNFPDLKSIDDLRGISGGRVLESDDNRLNEYANWTVNAKYIAIGQL